MVFIDTPLDLALSRRILRNLANEDPEETSKKLGDNLQAYVNEARPIYLHFIDQMKQTSGGQRAADQGDQPLGPSVRRSQGTGTGREEKRPTEFARSPQKSR